MTSHADDYPGAMINGAKFYVCAPCGEVNANVRTLRKNSAVRYSIAFLNIFTTLPPSPCVKMSSFFPAFRSVIEPVNNIST